MCSRGNIRSGNVWLGKCQVREALVGKLSGQGCVSRGSVGQGNVQSGKCPDSHFTIIFLKYEQGYSKFVEKFLEDLYIDDATSGAHTVTEGKHFYITLLNR